MSKYLELKQQAELLLEQAESARKEETTTAIAEIKEKMAFLQLTLQDLRYAGIQDNKPTNKAIDPKTIPKYKGPKGELWSGGRGRKPDWALEAIAKDGTSGLEKYKIKN